MGEGPQRTPRRPSKVRARPHKAVRSVSAMSVTCFQDRLLVQRGGDNHSARYIQGREICECAECDMLLGLAHRDRCRSGGDNLVADAM